MMYCRLQQHTDGKWRLIEGRDGKVLPGPNHEWDSDVQALTYLTNTYRESQYRVVSSFHEGSSVCHLLVCQK